MPVKRSYDAPRRQEQARATRAAVLAAAGDLFVTPGYAATTLAAIAARAGVSVQTVHKVFGSKGNLLSALVDTMIAGDDEDTPLGERPFVAEIRALPTGRAKLARYAAHLVAVHARQAAVMAALAGAATADPDANAVWQKNLDERRQAMTMFAADLATSGELREDRSREAVVDVLWLAMDVRNYDWLVVRRGWTREEYCAWYVETVAAAVLRPAP